MWRQYDRTLFSRAPPQRRRELYRASEHRRPVRRHDDPRRHGLSCACVDSAPVREDGKRRNRAASRHYGSQPAARAKLASRPEFGIGLLARRHLEFHADRWSPGRPEATLETVFVTRVPKAPQGDRDVAVPGAALDDETCSAWVQRQMSGNHGVRLARRNTMLRLGPGDMGEQPLAGTDVLQWLTRD